ncbi:MAG TPA: hypothetical protein PK205_10635 [Promineifilum sp.]|nr:hypothetical protein [Promineifilum sp.]HRQ13748.1 hypothetical protein [Promineifilum sp.]
MNYTTLIGDSWRLVWRRKSLIALGSLSVLASILAYVALYIGFIAFFLSSPSLLIRLMGMPLTEMPEASGGPLGYIAMVLGALAWLLLWLVGLSARGGMIAAVDAHEDGRSLGAGAAFGRGWSRALTLAAMAIVVFLPVMILYLITIPLLFSRFPDLMNAGEAEIMSALMTTQALSCSLSLLIYGLMALLQFIYAFAYRGVVLGGLGVMASIRHGWRVLRGNAGDILPLALIFGGIWFGLIVLWYIAFFVIYLILLFGLALGSGDVSLPLTIAAAVGFFILLLVTLLAGGAQSAWRSAAFTSGYRYWIAEKKEPAAVEASPMESADDAPFTDPPTP